VVCRWFSTTVKESFKYDDSLDVFGVHGVGGFLGTCVLGIFGHTYFGGFNEVRCISLPPSTKHSHHSHHSRHHSCGLGSARWGECSEWSVWPCLSAAARGRLTERGRVGAHA